VTEEVRKGMPMRLDNGALQFPSAGNSNSFDRTIKLFLQKAIIGQWHRPVTQRAGRHDVIEVIRNASAGTPAGVGVKRLLKNCYWD
jgi:hypothetical protein